MKQICLGLALVAAAWAQSVDPGLRFEVASIKVSANQGTSTRMAGGPGTSDPGRFTASNAELSVLVLRAYDIQEDQLRRPAWMDAIQFDVVARVPQGTTAEQFRTMLQSLLAERFGMRVHREMQVRRVYELTVATTGPKMKPAAQGSGTDDFVPGGGPRQADRDNFPVLPPGRSNGACGHFPQGSYCTFRMVTMEMFAQRLILPNFLGSRVVDKTGLVGPYDFTLNFSQMNGQSPDPDDNAPPLSAPPIEAAIQQQLGLKLSPTSVPIEVVVIDSAEKTVSEN